MIPPQGRDCIVCGTAPASEAVSADKVQITCLRCGSFTLTESARAELPGKLGSDIARRSKMSHVLRRAQGSHGFEIKPIRSDELESYWSLDRLPNPIEATNNLVLWLGENQQYPHRLATPTTSEIAAHIGWLIDPEGGDSAALGWLFSMIEPRGLFRKTAGDGNRLSIQLAPDGWQKYAELSQVRLESRTAFMAMQFGDPTLEEMVQRCFKPAVARTGFTLRKLNDEQPAGLIDNQMRAALLSARFVVADLSHANLGAYWEAGYAEGLGRPVMYTCEKLMWDKKKTHFDTNHMLTIIWQASDQKRAEDQLAAAIRATLRSEAIQTDNGAGRIAKRDD
jgi:nucleoside 2-deoxyribosyltransferase